MRDRGDPRHGRSIVTGIQSTSGLLASIMRSHPVRAALAAILALAAPLALADVYTWKDASGRLNVSNIAPPEGVRVESVVHEDPPKPSASAIAARDAARAAGVQTLNERVAQLEDAIDRARQQPALPPVVYQPAPSAPPLQVTVNVMPSAPAPASVPAYAPPYPVYSGYPYPGYPGLPYDYCDPTIFGCPFLGYPVGGVVLLNSPHAHAKHFNRMRGAPPARGMRPPTPTPMPMPASMPMHGGFARR